MYPATASNIKKSQSFKGVHSQKVHHVLLGYCQAFRAEMFVDEIGPVGAEFKSVLVLCAQDASPVMRIAILAY